MLCLWQYIASIDDHLSDFAGSQNSVMLIVVFVQQNLGHMYLDATHRRLACFFFPANYAGWSILSFFFIFFFTLMSIMICHTYILQPRLCHPILPRRTSGDEWSWGGQDTRRKRAREGGQRAGGQRPCGRHRRQPLCRIHVDGEWGGV